MILGAIRVLQESAGYTTRGKEAVIAMAEHCGKYKANNAAIDPNVMKLGVVEGIIRPPASDVTLSYLPKHFTDNGKQVDARKRAV